LIKGFQDWATKKINLKIAIDLNQII